MNVFHFGDDDAKESAEENPVTQKSSHKENIIRKSKCNNKHLAVVDDDDDDEDGDNTARGILLEDLYRSTPPTPPPSPTSAPWKLCRQCFVVIVFSWGFG